MKLAVSSVATEDCASNVNIVQFVQRFYRIAHVSMHQFQRMLNQKELKDTLQKNLPSLRGRARDGMALYKRMTASRMAIAESIRHPTKNRRGYGSAILLQI